MNLIYTHIITQDNIESTTLCPAVDYRIEGNCITFYNSTFDSVFIIEAKTPALASMFVDKLQSGVLDMTALTNECFSMKSDMLIAALFQKRIIE